MAEELEKLGFEVDVRVASSRKGIARLIPALAKADAIIFQKTYSRHHLTIQRLARRMGKLTFVDIDDWPSRTDDHRTLSNFADLCAAVDGVFAGSENLVNLARRSTTHVHLVPSTVRLANYSPLRQRAPGEPVCFGWLGNGAHYKNDLLELLVKPLSRIAAQHPVRFRIVGACRERALYEAFTQINGVEATLIDQLAWSDPSAVSAAMADVHVGLYPLRQNDFNRYKCAFKAVEYMAFGIPVVASAVGANGAVVAHRETGFVVANTDEWTGAVFRLATEPDLARAMGERGRHIAETHYSTQNAAATIGTVIGGCLASGNRRRAARPLRS